MNIENLCREALEKLKSEFGIPRRGFIAGGSLANTIWELVSGNKAVVNDIDVFIFRQKTDIPLEETRETLFRYKETDKKFYEDYTGICWSTYTKNYYAIVSSETNGIFNEILYDSNTEEPQFILNSFDINCTRVGYSIELDKFYWTKDFEDFLNNSKLLVSNLTTPSHTAVRIFKKSKELNIPVDDFEFKIISKALNRAFNDSNKLRFKERYNEIYEKYSDELSVYFKIERDLQGEEYIKSHFNSDDKLYYLVPVKYETKFDTSGVFLDIWGDDNVSYLYTSKDFLFYIRNIYGNEELKKYWNKLSNCFETVDYIDCEPSEKDFNLLSRFLRYSPKSLNKLKYLKLSKQIELIKTLLGVFSEDPIIAISLLESDRFEMPEEFDDSTKLLLELSVRKEIVNDNRGKVRLILQGEELEGNSKLFED